MTVKNILSPRFLRNVCEKGQNEGRSTRELSERKSVKTTSNELDYSKRVRC